MEEQLELSDFMKYEARKSFEEYHKEHPEIYELFKKFTFEAIDAGLEHFSSRAIVDRIRWHAVVEKKGTFKINNNFCPGYARLFAQHFPEYSSFFRTRMLTSDLNKELP